MKTVNEDAPPTTDVAEYVNCVWVYRDLYKSLGLRFQLDGPFSPSKPGRPYVSIDQPGDLHARNFQIFKRITEFSEHYEAIYKGRNPGLARKLQAQMRARQKERKFAKSFMACPRMMPTYLRNCDGSRCARRMVAKYGRDHGIANDFDNPGKRIDQPILKPAKGLKYDKV